MTSWSRERSSRDTRKAVPDRHYITSCSRLCQSRAFRIRLHFTSTQLYMSPGDRSLLISSLPRRASPDESSFCDDPPPDRCSSSEPSVEQCKSSSRSRSRNRIPRPRNAFMIFRSEFCAEEKISRSVERDHRHISRIIGYYWNKMSEAEKDIWRRKAEQEKMEHLRKYPGYRFTPTVRTKRPAKRNVKRNGAEDLLRCQLLADLLILGKEGNELENAAKSLKAEAQARTDHSIKSFNHSSQEGGNILTCSPSPGSNIVDAVNLPYHMGLVLDPFKQDVVSGVMLANSAKDIEDAGELLSNHDDFSRSFHRFQESNNSGFGAYYRPTIERHAASNWRQSEINWRWSSLMAMGTDSQCYDLPLFDPNSTFHFATH